MGRETSACFFIAYGYRLSPERENYGLSILFYPTD